MLFYLVFFSLFLDCCLCLKGNKLLSSEALEDF